MDPYRLYALISLTVLLPFQCSGESFEILVNTTTVIAELELNFLSLAIDADIIAHFNRVDFTSTKLLTLCQGFSLNSDQPEIYLRIGGTKQDNIVWKQSSVDDTTYILNSTEWDLINNFAAKLKWKLLFGLNSLQRKHDKSWDPTNAILLMRYTASKGYNINFELGNEPDLYLEHRNISVTPDQLSRDFALLKVVLQEELRGAPLLVGPDVATLTRDEYFQKFLLSVEAGILNAVTFHHYYGPSENATLSDFTDPKYLDTFITYAAQAKGIIKSATATKDLPVWLGETSSTYGGGAPGLSDSFAGSFLVTSSTRSGKQQLCENARTFLGHLFRTPLMEWLIDVANVKMWLDKLGIAAQMNISVVIRQSLVQGHYALLDEFLDPLPNTLSKRPRPCRSTENRQFSLKRQDYWLSVLHKHLVGRKVLNITDALTMSRKLRLYAHCANEYGGMGYGKGVVTVTGMNLDPNGTADVTFTGSLAGLAVDQYLLQPASGYLFDKSVSLNGQELKLINGSALPSMKPLQVEQPIHLPPFSLGFFVFPSAKVEVCL